VDLLLVVISAFQLQLGLTEPVFQLDFKYSIWCEDGWLTICCECMWDHDICLEIPGFLCSPLRREGDRILMNTLYDLNEYDDWQMKILKRCRI
jgi:hypothetical protein